MLIEMRYDATMSESWQNKQHREILEVKTAIESFPETFQMACYGTRWFRIAPQPWSYHNGTDVQLVVRCTDGVKWYDFCRATPDEIRREIVCNEEY
jgi:hypothetical protein